MSKTPITFNFVNLARPSFTKSKAKNGNVKIKCKNLKLPLKFRDLGYHMP